MSIPLCRVKAFMFQTEIEILKLEKIKTTQLILQQDI